MNKQLQYWRPGDPLTARKLTHNLEALSERIEYNSQQSERLLQLGGMLNHQRSYTSPQPSWYDVTGARIVTEEQAVKEGITAGLYALPARAGTYEAPADNASGEVMLASLSSIAAGGGIYAHVSVDRTGMPTSAEFIYAASAPSGYRPSLSANLGGEYYWRVQQLSTNPQLASSSADAAYNLELLPALDMDLPHIYDNYQPSGSSTGSDNALYRWGCVLGATYGNTTTLRTIEEGGGVSIDQTDTAINISAGIEFLSSGASSAYTDRRPQPSAVTVGWPVSVNGASAGSLSLTLTPMQSWRWKVASSGSLNITATGGAGGVTSLAQYRDSVPDDGVDGWVLTSYMPMVYTASDSSMYSYRQLMRINNGVLQISHQRAPLGGTWSPFFNAYD